MLQFDIKSTRNPQNQNQFLDEKSATGGVDESTRNTIKSSKSKLTGTNTLVPHRGSLRRVYLSGPSPGKAEGDNPKESFNSSSKKSDQSSYQSPDNLLPTTQSSSQSSYYIYVISICTNTTDIQSTLAAETLITTSLPSSSCNFLLDNQPQHDSCTFPNNRTDINRRTTDTFELHFEKNHYEFMSRLFCLLDTESRGSVGKGPVLEFAKLRCPVFRRRDLALRRLRPGNGGKQDKGKDERRKELKKDYYGVEGIASDGGDGRAAIDTGSVDILSEKEEELINISLSASPTFDEVWHTVITCSTGARTENSDDIEIGIEGWMVFCRFIALAQYQEAKRRFSARHLQQTMRHKNKSGRGAGETEVVLVNVPPPEPPAPLTVKELVQYEMDSRRLNQRVDGSGNSGIALPELDLDHCLVSAHDDRHYHQRQHGSSVHTLGGAVRIEVFGAVSSTKSLSRSSASSSSASLDSSTNLEFVLTFFRNQDKSPIASDGTKNSKSSNTVVVRRSFSDMEWLNDTFNSHKQPGGTLCGRILPPFPTRVGKKRDYDDQVGSSSLSSLPGKTSAVAGGAAAIAVASAGVGMISSMAKSAKSLWGGCISSATSASNLISSSGRATGLGADIRTSNISKVPTGGVVGMNSGVGVSGRRSRGMSYNLGRDNLAETSSSKARQLERYLNYLLEHPALSTSFPMNAILKASQSGLDSAKHILEDHGKTHRHRRGREQFEMSQIGEGEKPYSLLNSVFPQGISTSQHHAGFTWVRTAAQAALALQLHGILETTGCQSASAKLQHASLPSFGSRNQTLWNDDDDDNDIGLVDSVDRKALSTIDNRIDKSEESEESEESEFERGVVNVESKLGEDHEDFDQSGGYDLLPAPLPLPERSALCAGSVDSNMLDKALPRNTPAPLSHDSDLFDEPKCQSQTSTPLGPHPGFHYGCPPYKHYDPSNGTVVLGDISVDGDIDRLREIIGSVDNTLSRCLDATVTIAEARRKRAAIHLDILGGLDAWEGMRGEIIAQRGLLTGVAALKMGYGIAEKNSTSLSSDLSWHASLASSAVRAAKEVRSAVRAARTAAGAKLAADTAAMTAQKVCKTGEFSSIDEARSAHTRASIAQSHAIHAAVVEHEAMAAKRRAAMALAHDVKCWNVHRKRELLRICLESAKDQRRASQQCTDAWEKLRDGLIKSSPIPLVIEKRVVNSMTVAGVSRELKEATSIVIPPSLLGLEEDERISKLMTPTDDFVIQASEIVEDTEQSKEPDNNQFVSGTSTANENFVTNLSCPNPTEAVEADLEYGDEMICGSELILTDEMANLSAIERQQINIGPELVVPSLADSVSNVQPQKGDSLEIISPETSEATLIDENLQIEEDIRMICEPEMDILPKISHPAENIPVGGKSQSVSSNQVIENAENILVRNGESFEQNANVDGSTKTSPGTINASSSILLDNLSKSEPGVESECDLKEVDDELSRGSEHDPMTDSMQSLVDGLMAWGGQWDSQDDHSLPSGMAATLALEESGMCLSSGLLDTI